MGNLLPENRSDSKLADVENPDPLNLAVRSQQNWAENVNPNFNSPLFTSLFLLFSVVLDWWRLS